MIQSSMAEGYRWQPVLRSRWPCIYKAKVRARSLPLEVVAVWLLLAVVAVEILVTYSRLPAYELYHVTGSGLAGGASRALVFSNFPTALVAIAVLAIVADRLANRFMTVAALFA